MTFTEFIRDKRIAAGIAMREFCRRTGEDPSNWSKIERGILPPPEKLDRLLHIGKALGFEEGSADMSELFNLADIARGQIPRTVMRDSELVAHLPIVFRSLTDGDTSREELLALADRIREAHQA